MTSHTPSTEPATELHRYDAAMANAIEAKWQGRWDDQKVFRAPNPGEPGFDAIADRPKQYVLDMFPYPSGVGLHVGHPLGYIATDIYARYLRAAGFNVLHAMGFDAFGLPAEQYAVQTGAHPRETTEANIANMQRQLQRLGLAHDDRRSVATTDVDFYRWTQWIFLQIFNAWYDPDATNGVGGKGRARPITELIDQFERGDRPTTHSTHNPDGTPWNELDDETRRRLVDGHRLAYLDEAPVNWCPALGTVLANEEVTADGRSERGNHPVYKRPLKQWMMRITAYSDRLLADLEQVRWPEPIKLMQRNWIGRSEGAWVDFPVERKTDADVFFVRRRTHGYPTLASKVTNAIRVFTTRPDTLFGATYMVLAPEHPLVDELVADEWPHDTNEKWKGRFEGRPKGTASPRALVDAYRKRADALSDVQRQESREKTGVFIGAYAINPTNRERIPIFIADYVLMSYGSGAIMAVPGHDHRDFEFAREFEIPIRAVVTPPDGWLRQASADFGAKRAPGQQPQPTVEELRAEYLADPSIFPEPYTEDGAGANSSNDEVSLDRRSTAEAKRVIINWLASAGVGQRATTYKLRDWLFSRQRYWGEPFPIVYDSSGLPIAVPDDSLPVELPELDDFTPKSSDDPTAAPEPPLGRAADWAEVELDGVRYRRELNTMPQWAGSCWYYLRYLDPENSQRFVDEQTERYWMLSRRDDANANGADTGGFDPSVHHWGGVDLYVGGAEHAVLHLLYARFWHKVLFDLGQVSTPEPFGRLFNQGYIQAFAYTNSRGVYVSAEDVEERDGAWYFEGEPVTQLYGKMGKSLKNAVTPDDICEQYGADTLRVYEMSMGPLDQSKPWNTRDIIGSHRFLQRVWRNLIDERTGEPLVSDDAAEYEIRKKLHKTIDKVGHDMSTLSFNTAISALIELNNALVSLKTMPREVAEPLVKMIAPFAPHFAEEVWERMGHPDTCVTFEPFPVADAKYLVENEVELVVQVMGKVRGKVTIPSGATESKARAAAEQDPNVASHLEGKTVRKVIYVPNRLINFVAN
ncbi:MAG: leucine--tRNA ligase [Phycisphaerales bacterium]